jgi:pimeloyl-ACP methyl ester carboxylesterase
LHVRIAGGGPLVVLLHGWPQTSYAWRRLIPLLVGRYTVVAPDLRGCGDSDRPDNGYDKAAVAADIAALIEHASLGAARVAGHDWGGAVGYLLAATYPNLVSHFAAVETVLPGFGLAELADVRHGQQDAWWMSFCAAADMPEMLVAGREREFLAYFYSQHAYNPTAIGANDVDEYVRCYAAAGAMRAGFNYYRTLVADEAAFKALPQVTCPVLCIGGKQRLGELVAASVRQASPHSTNALIDQCGHYPAEEQPVQLANMLMTFFDPQTEATFSTA